MTEQTEVGRIGRSNSLLLDCPAELLDGWMVHTAAIQRRLHTWLLPGQALLAGPDGVSVGVLTFAHGVPRESQLSMATLVQDKRIRRAILQDHEIPIPRGATFSIGFGAKDARRFAGKIGYPVVVKPMVGDNSIETLSGISSRSDLNRAISYLETAPPFRPAHTASSYAFTAIQTPREDGSRETRYNYRYLVEKQVTGRYIRALVIEEDIVSAVYAPDGAWSEVATGEDVLDRIHPSFEALIERVQVAFPGLSVVAIDVVMSEGPEVPVDEQDVVVVEVSERPWLQLQRRYSPERVHGLGEAILAASANHHQVELASKETQDVGLSVRWEGVSHPTAFLQAMKATADRMNLRGWARMDDPVGGVAVGHLDGAPDAIALLAELAVDGRLDTEAVMSVETAAAPLGSFSGFELG